MSEPLRKTPGRPHLSGIEWLGISLLALALAALVWGVVRRQDLRAQGDGPDHIQFMAVRPDSGDSLYDVDGAPTGHSLYDGPSLPSWSSNRMWRGYLFETTNISSGSLTATCQVRLRGSSRVLITTSLVAHRLADGRIRLEGAAALPRRIQRPFLFFWHKMDDLRQVDLTVTYHDTTGGDARVRFQGPFKIGEKHRLADQTTLERVLPENPGEGRSAFRIIQLQTVGPLPSPVLLRADGRPVSISSSRSSANGMTNIVDMMVLSLNPEDEVAEIRIPQRHTRVFRNVTVDIPDLALRTYPVAYDRMAVTAGITNVASKVRSARRWTASATEVLRNLEHLRGPHILSGWRTLQKAYPHQRGSNAWSGLSTSDQNRLRKVAWAWTEAASPSIRLAGIGMGLNGAWPEFVEPARALVTLEEPHVSLQATQWLSDQAERSEDASKP